MPTHDHMQTGKQRILKGDYGGGGLTSIYLRENLGLVSSSEDIDEPNNLIGIVECLGSRPNDNKFWTHVCTKKSPRLEASSGAEG